jgi:hypothetical protein
LEAENGRFPPVIVPLLHELAQKTESLFADIAVHAPIVDGPACDDSLQTLALYPEGRRRQIILYKTVRTFFANLLANPFRTLQNHPVYATNCTTGTNGLRQV